MRSDCYTEAFPDAKLHVDGQIVAEADTVATPYVFTGTHPTVFEAYDAATHHATHSMRSGRGAFD